MKHLSFFLLIVLSITSYGQTSKGVVKKNALIHGSYFIDTTFVEDPVTGQQLMKISKMNTDEALKDLDKKRKKGTLSESDYVEQRKYILSISHQQ